MRSGLAIGVLGAVAIGCSSAAREDDSDPVPTGNSESATSGPSGTGSPTVTDSATSTSSPGTTDADSSSSTMDPFILDVGFDTEGESASATKGDMGCRKVDFLFIIDNSGSMQNEQDELISSFPGFIDTIQSTIADAQDYHVMVLDTDAFIYGGCDATCTLSQCFDANGVCDPLLDFLACVPCLTYGLTCLPEGYTCANPITPLECEDILGAGVVHPRGGGATGQDCNFASGARYMDSSEPDLAAAFQCAARVGTGSTEQTERPMEAMVSAVSPQTEAFACNEGFIRDDAILVVTFVTDEDDNKGDSAGSSDGWRQALIAAKGGDESAVVVLGLFGDNDQPGALCQDDPEGGPPEDSERLREFVESWGPRGFSGSICANDYTPFFEEAVGIIDTTCEEFQPPEG